MPFVPRKAPSRCPHCGFVQDEPEHLISTYCQRLRKPLRGARKFSDAQRFRIDSTRILIECGGRAPSLPARKIRCHRCGQIHEVSGHARNNFMPSLQCSDRSLRCHNLLQLASRPIDTRGNLTITSSGYVCSALTVCREAFVAGRISGTLVCEGTLDLTCSERLCCQINAAFVIIERTRSPGAHLAR